MTVNMKQAARRQTIKHFMYTFMKDYDTEKAADRTMRSKYVPRNLKIQLVSAMSDCDAADRHRIERVAKMGMFIDNSCNELVYYNTVTTAVVRWTVSLYVDSDDVKNLLDAVMKDTGKVCDDDIQFIMDKYRYMEENSLSTEHGSYTDFGGLIGFLKTKKQTPDVSLIRYYSNTLWLRVLRAVLKNSVSVFNAKSFSDVFAGLVGAGRDEGDEDAPLSNGLDDESKALYREFRENRNAWLKSNERTNYSKVEKASDAWDGEGVTAVNRKGEKTLNVPPVAPPEVSVTAFDTLDEDDRESCPSVEDGLQLLERDAGPLVVARPMDSNASFTSTMTVCENKLHVAEGLKELLFEEKRCRAVTASTGTEFRRCTSVSRTARCFNRAPPYARAQDTGYYKPLGRVRESNNRKKEFTTYIGAVSGLNSLVPLKNRAESTSVHQDTPLYEIKHTELPAIAFSNCDSLVPLKDREESTSVHHDTPLYETARVELPAITFSNPSRDPSPSPPSSPNAQAFASAPWKQPLQVELG